MDNHIAQESADSKKPVLLQVLPSLYSGGVERGTVEIAKAAAQAGFTSLVVSSGGNMVRQVEDAGAEHITLDLMSKNPINILRNIGDIRAIIESYGVDIVHARSRAPAWSAYFAAKKTDAHFLTTFHGVYSSGFPFKKLYNSIMTKGERVIAVSNFIKEHIEKNYSVDAAKIQVIHRGVDMDYFDPAKVTDERRNILKEKWRIENDCPIIFLPARITRWKGQSFLLDALSRISDLPFYCIMAGDNFGHAKYYDELIKKISQYGLEKKLRIVDAVDDMPAAYSLADVVVSASLRPEAFGRVAIEAQAMGKPIVASDLGGSKETIIHGETGRLVSIFTSGELSEGIKRGISLDLMEKQGFIDKSRAHIEQNFSAKVMCDKTIALYRSILS